MDMDGTPVKFVAFAEIDFPSVNAATVESQPFFVAGGRRMDSTASTIPMGFLFTNPASGQPDVPEAAAIRCFRGWRKWFPEQELRATCRRCNYLVFTRTGRTGRIPPLTEDLFPSTA